MDFLTNPTVKLVLIVLSAANAAVLNYPGISPTVLNVCSILSAVFVALGVGVVRQQNLQLNKLKAVKP